VDELGGTSHKAGYDPNDPDDFDDYGDNDNTDEEEDEDSEGSWISNPRAFVAYCAKKRELVK